MDTITQSIQDLSVSTDMGDLLQAFGDHLLDKNCSACTIQAFSQDVHAFSTWCEAEYKAPFTLDNFNRRDLRAFQRWSCDGQHVSPATWNRRVSGLRAFIHWLSSMDLMVYDPSDVFKLAEQVKGAPRWMTEPEFRAFNIALEKHVNVKHRGLGDVRHILRKRDYAMVTLMLYAGLRVAEVCQLNRRDVIINERSGEVVVHKGKGSKMRKIPLSKEARAAIGPWLDERNVQGTDPLFVNEKGQRIQTRSVQRLVTQLGKMAGLDVSCHDLRHTFAKRMVNAKVGLECVKELLGHSNLNTTLIYVAPGWEDLANAVETV